MNKLAEVPEEAIPEERDKEAGAEQFGEVFDILTKQKLSPEEIERRVAEGNVEDILERAYEEYKKLRGIINRNDYRSIIDRAREVPTLRKVSISQAKGIAQRAGITLLGDTDPRIMLYAIMRSDTKPEGVEHHHSQMSDQRLFAEAARILGDKDSLKKLIEAYPKISF
ncbi:MAG: hypothetical protein AAB691_00805 [Patescibacteria group bacterium]